MSESNSNIRSIWMVIIIFFIFFSILIYCKILRLTEMGVRDDLRDRFDIVTKTRNRRNYRFATEGQFKGRRLELPLFFDINLGLYKTEITLTNGVQTKRFNPIADTGSNKLLVPGSSCISCNRNDGFWDLNYDLNLTRAENDSGIDLNLIKTVRYGGGQISNYIDETGTIIGFDPNDIITFGVIINSKSPDGRSESVMGLQPDSEGFLSSLEIDKKIQFDFKGKRLSLGDISIPKNLKYCAHNIFYPGSTETVKFIVVGIEGLNINGWPVPINLIPRYGMIDVGTTNTIVNSQLYDFIHNKRQHINHIGMTLEGGSSREIPFYNSILDYLIVDHLPNNETILIGNQWLKQYSLLIDLDTDRIYFE